MKQTTKTFFRSLFPVLAFVAACSSHPGQDESPESLQQAVTAVGAVPAGLPGHVMVGLMEAEGQTWMGQSGVPWDARYRYLTKGWVNNWGWSPYDGTFAAKYMTESATKGYVPAFAYYQMQDEAGGGEESFLKKTQNATTMKSYFGDFKILMQRVKTFGKPTMILLEADGYALLQQQSNGNPNAYAAVAASGVPELAGLPNTVAGWGMAFLQMKKAVGASNAILGIHISGWASSKDLFHTSVTDPLGPEVDKVYNFLAPFGITANATGQTYDVLVGDPLDRDADYFRIVQGKDRWWDASDTASVSSKSFNRYAEWLRLWNVKSNKRWVLWQIPEGNSNHLNVNNNGGARQGYKDNRPEYFFGNGKAHVTKFAANGVIGLLFGPGMTGMSSHVNDIYTDGQPFLKSRVASFYSTGGVSLDGASPPPPPPPPPADAGAPPPPPPDAGTIDSGTPSPIGDPSRYGFETSTQGWAHSGGMITSIASSSAKAFAGSKSLAVTFAGAGADTQSVFVSNPSVAAGQTITFRIWVPTGSRITSVQPYALQGSTGGWTWTGNWQSIANLAAGSWKALTVTVPASAKTPLYEIGVEVTTSGAWSGTCYVDAVTWP